MSSHSIALGIGALGLTLTLLIGLGRAFLVIVTVTNTSMQPTLVEGDRVLVVRHWPRRWLRRGQIVIVWPFAFPEKGPAPFGVPLPFIKRVTALPGDIFVTYADQANRYFLEHERPFDKLDLRWNNHIPAEHLFAYGDNPVDSFDSRTWGPIPFRGVLGVVILKPTRPAVIDSLATLAAPASGKAGLPLGLKIIPRSPIRHT